jgi:hypothetical protein
MAAFQAMLFMRFAGSVHAACVARPFLPHAVYIAGTSNVLWLLDLACITWPLFPAVACHHGFQHSWIQRDGVGRGGCQSFLGFGSCTACTASKHITSTASQLVQQCSDLRHSKQNYASNRAYPRHITRISAQQQAWRWRRRWWLDGKAGGDLVHAVSMAGWLLPGHARRWSAMLEQQLWRVLLSVCVLCVLVLC